MNPGHKPMICGISNVREPQTGLRDDVFVDRRRIDLELIVKYNHYHVVCKKLHLNFLCQQIRGIFVRRNVSVTW